MRFGSLCAAALLLCSAGSLEAQADTKSEPRSHVGENVIVQVRILKGLSASPAIPRSSAGPVDRRMEDLRPKLTQLHFADYRFLSSVRRVVPLNRRETLPLVAGNSLTVRPRYMDQKKINMWIKWQDQTGTPLLDTRMNFNAGESVLTGTDHQADSGLILAIDVSPEKK